MSPDALFLIAFLMILGAPRLGEALEVAMACIQSRGGVFLTVIK